MFYHVCREVVFSKFKHSLLEGDGKLIRLRKQNLEGLGISWNLAESETPESCKICKIQTKA